MISFLLIFVGVIAVIVVGNMKSDNDKEAVPAVALHLIFFT